MAKKKKVKKKIKKTGKKKAKKKSKKKKKKLFWSLAGICLVVAGIFSVLYFFSSETETPTGAAIRVKYYGVSNYPIRSQAGKLQTYVKMTQPTLGNLQRAGTAISVARKIVEATDFANGMAGAVQGDIPVPVPTGYLDVVISAADYLTDKFKKDTKCLRKIGERYGNKQSVEFAVVTKPVYHQCSWYPDWNGVRARHTYYTMDGRSICSQDSATLFTLQQMTGKTSSSTRGC